MDKRGSGIIFVILSLAFVLFSLAPTLNEFSRRGALRPNRQFELVHNFPTDYNFYLSRIRQGLEGRWTVVERYTSEPHAGSFIHIFYLAFGQAGRLMGLSPDQSWIVYHASRTLLGAVLLLLIAWIAQKSFPSFGWACIAFLLMVTASTWPKLVWFGGGWRFGGYMSWWSLMDSLQRITFIPHILAGQALTLLLIVSLADTKSFTRGASWILWGIAAFILGIIFPPGMLFVGVVTMILVGLSWIVQAKRNVSRAWIGAEVIPRLVIASMGVPALLYLQLMATFYPWKRLAEFDIVRPLPFDYLEYFQAVGPILPLGLMGLILVLRKKEKGFFWAAAWALAWLLLLGVFRFIPAQSPLRFSEMLPHVPLGALAAYLLYEIFLYSRRLRVSGRTLSGNHESGLPAGKAGLPAGKAGIPSASLRAGMNYGKKSIAFIIHNCVFMLLALLLVQGAGVMYSSWLWQRDFIVHKGESDYPLVPTGAYVMYPLKDFIAAIEYLGQHAGGSVVLSEVAAGNYIPAYVGKTVYVGHANTVGAEKKEAYVKEFFGGRLPPAEAKQWMKDMRIGYVFFGPQEREDGLPAQTGVADLERIYPFLAAVYRNTQIIVYSVQ